MGWLTKAKTAFRRRQRQPVPYEIVSSAGKVIAGERRETHQVVTCPVTGERLFVLPLDAYPSPAERSRAKIRRRPRKGTTRSDVPEAAPSKEPNEDVRERRRQARIAAREAWQRRWQRARERASSARHWFTPLRTVLAVMVGVVLVTVWAVMQSVARQRAEITLRSETNEAWTALADGDVERSDEAFQRVLAALDRLGNDDPPLRRAAREVHVAVSLTDFPLMDVVADADRFDGRHAGSWIVLDASVFSVVDENGNEIVLIDYPLEVGGVPVDVVARPALFDGLDVPEDENAAPLQVVFAARLESLDRRDDPLPRWTLTLADDEAFLWVHQRTLSAVGIEADAFRTDDELAQLLARQAAAEGIEP